MNKNMRKLMIKNAQIKIDKRKAAEAKFRALYNHQKNAADKEHNRIFAKDLDIFMTDSSKEVKKIIDDSGITETYIETTKLDNDWD